jgi:hypothetical protein
LDSWRGQLCLWSGSSASLFNATRLNWSRRSGILNITFKYLIEIISPTLGWCSIGTFTNPCRFDENLTRTVWGCPCSWCGHLWRLCPCCAEPSCFCTGDAEPRVIKGVHSAIWVRESKDFSINCIPSTLVI